jgi:iron complex transport system permease protein
LRGAKRRRVSRQINFSGRDCDDISFVGNCFVTTLMDATRIRSFTFWLLGDLSNSPGNLLYVAFISAAIGICVLTINARSLNLLMLGERDAFDLGGS